MNPGAPASFEDVTPPGVESDVKALSDDRPDLFMKEMLTLDLGYAFLVSRGWRISEMF